MNLNAQDLHHKYPGTEKEAVNVKDKKIFAYTFPPHSFTLLKGKITR